MVFKRTASTLKNLEVKSEINLVDALGIFQDVCSDLESEFDMTLDELEVGNEKKIIGQMLHIGQEMLSVLKANKKRIADPDRTAKLKKQEDKLSAELTALEDSKEETEKLIEVKEKLIEVQKEREEQDKKKLILIRECDELEKEKKKYEQVELPVYEQKKLDLETEIADLKKQKLIQQINSLDENISVINIDVLKKRHDEKAEELGKLEKQKNDLETAENSLISDISSLTKEIKGLEERIPQKKEEISRLKHDKEAKKKNLDDVIKEKDTLKNWFNSLECAEIDIRLNFAQSKLDFLKNAVKELGKAMDKDLFMVDKESKQEVRKMREEFEMSIRELADRIDELRKSYAIISKAIYGGGDSIL